MHNNKIILHRTTTTKSKDEPTISFFRKIINKFREKPIEYATIPAVAAFVGISTNYMGVQMLFYPLDYTSIIDIKRIQEENENENDGKNIIYAPYGIVGWQGVVPARTEKMALRLVDIVTTDLLNLKDIFSKLDKNILSDMLQEPILTTITNDCGIYWTKILQPILPFLLSKIIYELQNDIENVLDLPTLVLNAFVRDKNVLVELFQKVGRVELDFLIKSGLSFGFVMGIGQMIIWMMKPKPWTLPIAGSLVGYITNWIAIKLLFEPADPIDVIGNDILTIQGLFESRQVEVSDEFAHFMEERVLSSSMLLHALTTQNENELFIFLRKIIPYETIVPNHVLYAAIKGIREVAIHPEKYHNVHKYMKETLDIESALAIELKKLRPKQFENLLHPVFQEDEIILIAIGGILGAIAGLLQIRVIFDGDKYAKLKSLALLMSSIMASAGFFFLSEYGDVVGTIDKKDFGSGDYDPVIDQMPKKLRRRNTVVRSKIDS